MPEPALSYAADIRPLFTEIDRDHMSFMLDLWSYEDVRDNADGIYDAVSSGRMPPSDAGGPWLQDKVDKFKGWVAGGCQP